MDDDDKHTLVEEGTEFSGTMRATCRVVVRGVFDGELEAPAVEITDTGIVTGTLKAKSVRSQGVLAGTVDVDDISVAGTVRSATVIRAKTLEVKLGTQQGKLEVTFGDCLVEVGEMPGDQPEVEDNADADSVQEASAAPADAAIPVARTEAETKPNGRDENDDSAGESKRARRRRKRSKDRGEQASADAGSDEADDDADDVDDAEVADVAEPEAGDEANANAPAGS